MLLRIRIRKKQAIILAEMKMARIQFIESERMYARRIRVDGHFQTTTYLRQSFSEDSYSTMRSLAYSLKFCWKIKNCCAIINEKLTNPFRSNRLIIAQDSSAQNYSSCYFKLRKIGRSDGLRIEEEIIDRKKRPFDPEHERQRGQEESKWRRSRQKQSEESMISIRIERSIENVLLQSRI